MTFLNGWSTNLPFDGKDKLIREALTEGSDTYIPKSALLHILTPTLAFAPSSTDELFKQFIKTYLEAQTQPA